MTSPEAQSPAEPDARGANRAQLFVVLGAARRRACRSLATHAGRRRFGVTVALLVLVFVLVAAPALASEPAPPSRFEFQVPEGWRRQTPAATRGSVQLAFDEANQLAFQAKVSPGAEPVTPEFLDKYVIESQKAVKRITGRELKVIEKAGSTSPASLRRASCSRRRRRPRSDCAARAPAAVLCSRRLISTRS